MSDNLDEKLENLLRSRRVEPASPERSPGPASGSDTRGWAGCVPAGPSPVGSTERILPQALKGTRVAANRREERKTCPSNHYEKGTVQRLDE